MTPEERAQFEEMKNFVEALKNAATIPYEVDSAIRDRFGLQEGSTVSVSTKNVDSEDQAVDEGGSASYNVLKEPDGFLKSTINGTTYYIPYYG